MHFRAHSSPQPGRKSAQSRLRAATKAAGTPGLKCTRQKKVGRCGAGRRRGCAPSARRLETGRAPWTRSPRSHPAGSSPRPRRRRPTRLQTRTKSVSRPGHQVRKLSLCLSPEAGGRRRCVQPEIPGPRQAQAGSYLRPRPARLPAPTARPAPETGSDRRQTPPKALELLPQPDPGAWDSAPSIRLRARSASPTSRAWAAPSLTPRRPAGRAGPARTAHRGRGKVSPLCSAPYPSNKSLCGLPCLHLGPLECRLQAMCWVCSQLKMPGVLATPPHP